MPLEQAMDRLLGLARPVSSQERLPTRDGLHRVLAAPVESAIDVPPWDNSAMDGYAIRSADATTHRGRLRVAQRIPAGVRGQPLAAGSAARIFTGAPLPEGADTVVIQELCEQQGDVVWVPGDTPAGANIRRAGEDIPAGATIMTPGTRLQPQHLGLAASVGVDELAVFRRLRVAVFSSGDELVMPGQSLGPGQIYNSNHYTLSGLLQALGCEVVHLGVVADTLEATLEALARGADQADLILASGGVSVGEEDHVRPAVQRLGSLDLWKLAIRPGKPLACGRIGDTPFIGTPGNPVSLFVTFVLFARPFILRMQGVTGEVRPTSHQVEADFDWPRPDKRREFVRARLAAGHDGAARAQIHPSRSSGVLSSVAWANGLAVIPEGRVVAKGEPIEFLPFSELLT